MGYIRHHAMIVTSWQESPLIAAHDQAKSLFIDTAAHVTPIGPTGVNNTASFAVLPDGSKEGWAESDRADEARAALKEYLRGEGSWCSWVEVQFGGDDYDDVAVEVAFGTLAGTVSDRTPGK